MLVDFVLRHVKKMVPPWRIAGAIRLSERAGRGPASASSSALPIGHDDIAFLQYTGGTTGVAKGAMLLHRNIVANLLQARRVGAAVPRRAGARSSSRRCRSITSSR